MSEPLTRSVCTSEEIRKYQLAEQSQVYTRMDLPRLQAILDGSVVMGLGEFSDIYHATLEANESHIPSNSLYHHRLHGALKKITWLEDGWNGEGSKGMPKRLVRRFLHHIRFVPDAHLKDWQLSITDEGELKMQRGTDALLLSWDRIHPIKDGHDIHMPFTKENFSSIMELYHLKRI